MLTLNDLIEINKEFDKGKIINKSGLEFAMDEANRSKDWITQLAYLIRGIVADHAFEEGNKRTGAAILMAYCMAHKKEYDLYKVDRIIRDLAQKKVTDISKIRRMIKNAII